MSTWLRIIAWPSPQSSVQMTGNVPVRVGVTTSVLSLPGTASCFCESSGTQKEWMTSFDVMSQLRVPPLGQRQEAVRLAVRIREVPLELLAPSP